MDFSKVVEDMRWDRLAARRFEKEGHSRYRDCVYVARNGKIFFERYCYGEAASLVFGLKAKEVQPDGTIIWEPGKASYERPEEAPQKLSGYVNGALQFDDKPALWISEAEMKTYPAAGLTGVRMFFHRLFG